MKGIVKWFNHKKGYGFILGADGIEYFVHYKSILMPGYKTLSEMQNVEFTPISTEKGTEAVDVSVI